MKLFKLNGVVTLMALLCVAGSAIAKVSFVPNEGQWDGQFQYKANIGNGALFFDANTIYVSLLDAKQLAQFQAEKRKNQDAPLEEDKRNISGHAYRIDFLNANTEMVLGDDKQSNYDNYFLGNDSKKWKSHVPVYQGLSYKQMYPGIDLIYFNNTEKLKYEFRAAAHSNTDLIQMKYTGADVRIDDKGNLVVHTSVEDVVEEAPYTYQLIEGKKITVPSAFEIKDDVVSYTFPEGYNKNYELVIDPVVLYKTYSGASANQVDAYGATYDTDGRMCALAQVNDITWPTTVGAFQSQLSGPNGSFLDISINIYSPNGSSLLYSTYLGGNATDQPNAAKFNALHQLILVGSSFSNNYPTTAGCINPARQGVTSQAIFTVFSADGTQLIGSTYFGSMDKELGRTLTISGNNSFYAGGIIEDAPGIGGLTMPAGSFMPNQTGGFSYDGFVVRVNTACTQLMSGTFLGGNEKDQIQDMMIDPATGDVIVIGNTISDNFPVTPGTIRTVASPILQPLPNAVPNDGYIIRLNAGLTQMVAGTYLERDASVMDLDAQGNIYVHGRSRSNFAPSPNTYSVSGGIGFLMKINPQLTNILLATRLGSPNSAFEDPRNYRVHALKRSHCGHFYLLSSVNNSTFGAPNTAAVDLTPNAMVTTPTALYLSELGPDFSSLKYGSWIGGNSDEGIQLETHTDFDPNGRLYINVGTFDLSWWGTQGAWKATSSVNLFDMGSMVIQMDAAAGSGGFTFAPNDTLCLGEAITFNATGVAPQANVSWNLGDGTTATNIVNMNHTYATPGTFKVLYSAIDTSTSCRTNTKDSVLITVNAPDTNISVFPKDTLFCAAEGLLNVEVTGAAKVLWSPGIFVADSTAAFTSVTHLGESNLTVAITDAGGCKSNKSVRIRQGHVHADAGPDKIITPGESVTLDGQNSIGDTVRWNASSTLSSLNDLTPNANPPVTTWYKINVHSGDCEATDSVKITVAGFAIPNAFSPNGDGLNDIFKIENTDGSVVKGSLSVYNRYGERIFHSDDINEGWNGLHKGQHCDLGTYFFSAKVRIGEKENTFKGDVTLIR